MNAIIKILAIVFMLTTAALPLACGGGGSSASKGDEEGVIDEQETDDAADEEEIAAEADGDDVPVETDETLLEEENEAVEEDGEAEPEETPAEDDSEPQPGEEEVEQTQESETEEIEIPQTFCANGESKCEGLNVQYCDQGEWVDKTTCGSGAVCAQKGAVADCVNPCAFLPCEYLNDPNRTVCSADAQDPYYKCSCADGYSLITGGNVEPTEICEKTAAACEPSKISDLGEFAGTDIDFSGDSCEEDAFITNGLGKDRCAGGVEMYGPDRAFKLKIKAGSAAIISVIPSEPYDPAVYVVESCASLSPCALGADLRGPGGKEALRFDAAQTDREIIFVVDSKWAKNGQAANDNYCGSYSIKIAAPKPCQIIPQSSLPFYLTSGTAGGSNDASTVIGDRVYKGADKIYSFKIEAGKTLKAKLTDLTADLDFYLLKAFDCYEGRETPDAISFSRNAGTSDEALKYYAAVDTDVYLVVDAEAGVLGEYKLSAEYDVSPASCEGVAQTFTVYPVNAQGTTITEDDDYFYTGCGWLEYFGRDAVYGMKIEKDVSYEITVKPFSSSFDGAIYLLSDCRPQQRGEYPPVCLGYADGADAGETETLLFKAQWSGNIFFVVDAYAAGGAGDGGSYFLTIEKKNE